MSTPPPRSDKRTLPPLLWVLLGALGAGVLLSLILLWANGRQKTFYTAEPGIETEEKSGQVEVFEPLPGPIAGTHSAGDGSLLPLPPANRDPSPAPPAPAAPPAAEVAAVKPVASTPLPAARTAYTAPVPVSQTAPRYPRSALKAGVGGLVEVQADIGPDGVPTSVSIARSSGTRELDRAALEAVRRWRFRPASENGQPTVGRVTVPIQFTAN